MEKVRSKKNTCLATYILSLNKYNTPVAYLPVVWAHVFYECQIVVCFELW